MKQDSDTDSDKSEGPIVLRAFHTQSTGGSTTNRLSQSTGGNWLTQRPSLGRDGSSDGNSPLEKRIMFQTETGPEESKESLLARQKQPLDLYQDSSDSQDMFDYLETQMNTRATTNDKLAGVLSTQIEATRIGTMSQKPKLDFFDMVDDAVEQDQQLETLMQELAEMKSQLLRLAKANDKIKVLKNLIQTSNDQQAKEESRLNKELSRVEEEQIRLTNKLQNQSKYLVPEHQTQIVQKTQEVEVLAQKIANLQSESSQIAVQFEQTIRVLAQSTSQLQETQQEMCACQVQTEGEEPQLTKEINQRKVDLIQLKARYNLQQLQLEKQDKDLALIDVQIEEAEAQFDIFSQVEILYRRKEKQQAVLTTFTQTNKLSRIQTNVARTTVHSTEQRLRHFKSYQNESETLVSEQQKDLNHLKEIGEIKLKVQAIQKLIEWETCQDDADFGWKLKEQNNLQKQVSSIQDELLESDRFLQSFNVSLPAEGVKMKEIDHEIFRQNLELEALDRDLGQLREKADGLLQDQKFLAFSNDSDFESTLNQQLEHLDTRLQHLSSVISDQRQYLEIDKSKTESLKMRKQELQNDMTESSQEVKDQHLASKVVLQRQSQNMRRYLTECDKILDKSYSKLFGYKNDRLKQIGESLLELTKVGQQQEDTGIVWVDYAEQPSNFSQSMELLEDDRAIAQRAFQDEVVCPEDDEFDIDRLIEERKSERSRRSSSGSRSSSQAEDASPKGSTEVFHQQNQMRRQKYITPTLRNIVEDSADELVSGASEYGSEFSGFERKTPRAEGSLASRLNAAAMRHSTLHGLEKSQVDLQSPKHLSFFQETTSEVFRPTIFDMQRRNSEQGGFRATIYDKTQPKKGKRTQDKNNSDETVLSDLLVCLLSHQSMLKINSDFEMSQGFRLFVDMLKSDPKCHEAMFGLGRINYIQGRYENAEKWLIKSYETQRDLTYRVWIGFTQLQLYKVCTQDNPKKIRFAQNAFSNLDRCSRESKVGLYANFGLLQLALELIPQQIKGLQEPGNYAILVKSDFSPLKYEGTLALALVNLKTKQEESSGLKTLTDLVASTGVSLAYFSIIRYYLGKQDFGMACQIAEEGMKKVQKFETFQERLTLTFLFCKCLAKTGQLERLLITLQLQYTESSHFSSLLYLYGKYIVQYPQLHNVHLAAGMSALQEVRRISCQVRSAKASYWLSVACLENGQSTLAGIYQGDYLSSIRQVTKCGSVKEAFLVERVDVSVQLQVIQQVHQLKYQQSSVGVAGSVVIAGKTKQRRDIMFASPREGLDFQGLEQAFIPDSDLVVACMRIQGKRDQQLYRAIALYRLKDSYERADLLFTTLMSEFQSDIEVRVENLKFLRHAIARGYQLKRGQSPLQEVLAFLEMLKASQVAGDLWADAMSESAKLLSLIAKKSPLAAQLDLQLKAIECLLQMKQVLPMIDTKIAAIKLPGNSDRYLFEEFDHIDFQAFSEDDIEFDQQDSTHFSFRPQDENDFDETNRFFIQSRYVHKKLQSCPLTFLCMGELRDQIFGGNKDCSVFFFGGAQWDLAYHAEELSQKLLNNQKAGYQARTYYKSSTPLIAVVKYLQNLRQTDSNEILPQSVKDSGFCVRSDPQFLYKIAKICVDNNLFIDLAVQCLLVYNQVMSYYRNFNDWHVKQSRSKILLALALKRMSGHMAEDKSVIDKIVKEEAPALKRVKDLLLYEQNAKLTLVEFQQLKTFKLLEKLMK